MAAGAGSGWVSWAGGRLLLLAAVLAAPAQSAACPAACHCRWKGGKKTMECVDGRLGSLPVAADADTQVLDISGHAMIELESRAFQRHRLLALQRIFVSRGPLEVVGARALSGLTNLVELDLGDNRLTAIPGDALGDVPALRRLSLSGNPLRRIRRGDLGALRELTSLELARCQLRAVEKGAFATLLRLEWLQLQGNQLATLASVDLSLHLHGVQLQDNLWQCNCRLRELRRWLRRYPVPLTVPPRCSAPRRLAGRAVHNTSATELACEPDILTDERLFEVSLNSSVTLSCGARADPAAELTWTFNGHLLASGAGRAEDADFLITERSEISGDGSGAVRRSELVIPSAGEHDHGVFRCRAANAAGVSTADYRVSVLLPPDTRSSGTAPASRSHLALPVGGSLVLLAASALLLLGALAVRRGRRLRLRRKFSTRRDSGSGEIAATPTGAASGGGSAGSRAVSRDTTLTDCHEHQLQELPRRPASCTRERGPDVLCDAGDTVTAVTVEREPLAPQEPGVRAIQDLSWPPAWTLNPTLSASHGNIYGDAMLRRNSYSSGSCHRHLCDASSGAAGRQVPLGWRSLPRPARPRPPPPSAAGSSPERWRRSVLAVPQFVASAPHFVAGAPQLVAVDPARVCSCMLGPSLEGRLWQLPACRPAAPAAVPAPPPPPWPARTQCVGAVRPRCRCLAQEPAAPGPLAPPAGFGDELPPPGPLKWAPPPRWAARCARDSAGASPQVVFASRLVAAERPADSPDEGYVESAPDA